MSYFSPTGEQISKVTQFYKVTDSDLKKKVALIQKWIKQEKHLPQNVTDDWFIEMFLIRNKLSTELVKTQIEAYYAFKTMYKTYFENNQHIVPSKLYVYRFLGVLTPELDRISYFKLSNSNLDVFDFMEQCKYYLMTNELELQYDYSISRIIVVDVESMPFDMLKKINPLILRDYMQMWQGAYLGSVKAVHVVNIPSFINAILNMLKPVMSSELFDKIQLHENFESLYKVVPKDLLIKDLGGKDKSMKEYMVLMDQTIEDHRSFYKELPNVCSNEELRVREGKDKGAFQSIGANGNFKQINID